jgi:diguanylate cyclase (GGDEF)-like protein
VGRPGAREACAGPVADRNLTVSAASSHPPQHPPFVDALASTRTDAPVGGADRNAGDAAGGARAVVLTPAGAPLRWPSAVQRWLHAQFASVERWDSGDGVLATALRGRPAAVVIDGRALGEAEALGTCRRLKADSFTGIVPTVLVTDSAPDAARTAFEAGADEVLTDETADWEVAVRLQAMLRRSARDTGVHPTTRLPGAPEIETELARRLHQNERFAACYADLDHFKEFNDRYGYTEGDRVIRMVARLLHDVVKGMCGEAGFVGHIGGDDFLFIVSLDDVSPVCETIIETFELLVPHQYSESDQRAGYYLGKDRRGQLHRVPLMSLSIGVATTERRRYTEATQISRLASEMKSYAKAQPGSLYAVDRRVDDASDVEPVRGDDP